MNAIQGVNRISSDIAKGLTGLTFADISITATMIKT